MAIIEGTYRPHIVAKAAYDFAVDGGGIGTITLRSAPDDLGGNTVPAGAAVMGGFIDVSTAVTTTTGTVGLELEAPGDILADGTGAGTLTVGLHSVVPAFTGASAVETTVSRSLKLTIATAALTAGVFTVVLFYH